MPTLAAESRVSITLRRPSNAMPIETSQFSSKIALVDAEHRERSSGVADTAPGRSSSRSTSIALGGPARRGVKFHSLRHNVEDALRNADVRKEIRDAIQRHGENGVSREYADVVSALTAICQRLGHSDELSKARHSIP